MSTIYGLIEPISNRIRYIGVTNQRVWRRFIAHTGDARRGSDFPVCRWIRKLSQKDLAPSIIIIEQNVERKRETFWIVHFRNKGASLLNCNDGGGGNINPTVITRERMRQSQLGKRLSAEHRQHIAEANRGRKMTPEACRKISLSKLGKKRPEWVCRKMSLGLKGIKRAPRTAEHRAKLSAANKGKYVSPEICLRISRAVKGKKKSPRTLEHRRHLSEANKGKPGNRGAAKVTQEDVKAIRKRYAQGNITYKQLAQIYASSGITWQGIGHLIRRTSWADIE